MNRLSSVYVEISTKHIMPQVAELSKFLALPGTETVRIKRQISNSAKQMELDLQSHVKKERDSFKKIVNERMNAIENVVNQYIPPEITQEERKAIQEETREQYEDTKEALTDLYS